MLAKDVLRTIPQSARTLRTLLPKEDATLSIAQIRILLLVKEGRGQTEMADILQVSMAAVSKTINALESQKVIKRTTGDDKRCYKLSLTSKGQKVLDQVLEQVEHIIDKGIAKLDATEKNQLKLGLSVLEKLMQSLPELR